MINHGNAQLEAGKRILEDLNYKVELGARHLNVILNNEMTNDQMEELEKELSMKAGVEVWVMQECIMIVDVE